MNNVELLEHYLPDLAEFLAKTEKISKEDINSWTDDQLIRMVQGVRKETSSVQDRETSECIQKILESILLAIEFRGKGKTVFLG